MPPVNKRKRHIIALAKGRRECKRPRSSPVPVPVPAAAESSSQTSGAPLDVYIQEHEEIDSSDESEVEITDSEDDCEFDHSAFSVLISAARDNYHGNSTAIKYQRSVQPSKRTVTRARRKQRELAEAANSCHTLESMFNSGCLIRKNSASNDIADVSSVKEEKDSIQEAIDDLEKLLASKKASPDGQNRIRHEAVLHFLRLQQSRKGKESRADLAMTVARCFHRGKYFAEKIVSWERTWILSREIEKGRQGCFQKTKSWFNDEGVMLAVREWIAGAGEGNTSELLYNNS